jgi:hypothetical protein
VVRYDAGGGTAQLGRMPPKAVVWRQWSPEDGRVVVAVVIEGHDAKRY